MSIILKEIGSDPLKGKEIIDEPLNHNFIELKNYIEGNTGDVLTNSTNIALKANDTEVYHKNNLDSDDVIGKTHIETIVNQFDTDKYDFVYYNDYLVTNPSFKNLHLRLVETRYASIGTSAVTHKNIEGIKWQTGYGHDFFFIFSLVANGMRFKKLKKTPQYLVCHWSKGDY